MLRLRPYLYKVKSRFSSEQGSDEEGVREKKEATACKRGNIDEKLSRGVCKSVLSGRGGGGRGEGEGEGGSWDRPL